MQRAPNHIDGLLNADNILCTKAEEIENIICNYFTSLFSAAHNLDMDEVLDRVEPKVTDAMNELLCRLYTGEEVESTLKQMHRHKAPDPNGMNLFFYQRY